MKQTAFKVCLKYIFNDMVSLAGQLRVLKRRANMSKGVPGDSVVKNLPVIQESIPGSGRSLEKGMVIHSSILA